jgi:hypothetical protein
MSLLERWFWLDHTDEPIRVWLAESIRSLTFLIFRVFFARGLDSYIVIVLILMEGTDQTNLEAPSPFDGFSVLVIWLIEVKFLFLFSIIRFDFWLILGLYVNVSLIRPLTNCRLFSSDVLRLYRNCCWFFRN